MIEGFAKQEEENMFNTEITIWFKVIRETMERETWLKTENIGLTQLKDSASIVDEKEKTS